MPAPLVLWILLLLAAAAGWLAASIFYAWAASRLLDEIEWVRDVIDS